MVSATMRKALDAVGTAFVSHEARQAAQMPKFITGECVALFQTAELHHRDFIGYAEVVSAIYMYGFGYWHYRLLTNTGSHIEAPGYMLRSATPDERRMLGRGRAEAGHA